MYEHEPTQGRSSMNTVDSVLSDPSYNIQSSPKDARSHYDVLKFHGVAYAVAACRWVKRPRARGHLYCSLLWFGP